MIIHTTMSNHLTRLEWPLFKTHTKPKLSQEAASVDQDLEHLGP